MCVGHLTCGQSEADTHLRLDTAFGASRIISNFVEAKSRAVVS